MATKTGRTAQRSRRRLGRGLGSLISTTVKVEDVSYQPPRATSPNAAASGHSPPALDVITLIPVSAVQPNRRQPRQAFDEPSLDSLAASIRSDGLMQPILVRPSGEDQFELIAGERRWRAAQRVPLDRIPAVIRQIDDRAAAEWALIENLQREDLNPIEQAGAFQRLIEEHRLTHQELGSRFGLDRSTVSNLLRLNDLDDICKAAVRNGLLRLGHARALLAIPNIEARQSLARQVIKHDWSVREIERRVRRLSGGGATSRSDSTDISGSNPHLQDLEQRLGKHLGTRVSILKGRRKGSGKLVIEFYDLDQFDGLMRILGFEEIS